VRSGLVDFSIGFIVLIIFAVAYGIRPGPTALLLPLFLLLAIFTALGVGLWLSALNALYRDVRYLRAFLVQFWMLASPVAYPSSMVAAKYRWLYGLNPMAGFNRWFPLVPHRPVQRHELLLPSLLFALQKGCFRVAARPPRNADLYASQDRFVLVGPPSKAGRSDPKSPGTFR
jgi:ABC-type polysaccharide/polyol phosphate export permease